MTDSTARLTASLLRTGSRPAPTRRMALAPGQEPESAHAARIQRMLEEARAEMGYDRPGFVRVEHPDDMVPGTLMGRYRERVPDIRRDRD